MIRIILAGLLVMTALAGCNRNAAPMTECIGDKPAIPRVIDVGPPNCPDT